MEIIVKTPLGIERICASRILELEPQAEVIPCPRGFQGLVSIKKCSDKYRLAREIEKTIPEAERVIIIEAQARADLQEIAEKAAALAKERISSSETFAVRTVRRGKHSFTSIDVNVVVGDAVRKATGASVNLSYPDKIVLIEIIGPEAGIAIVDGSFELKKMRPGKHDVSRIFRNVALVQMPYLGPIDAAREIGRRVGREVQNFEVKELVVAPIGVVDGEALAHFVLGAVEGINSRYEVQRKSYHRRPQKVKVLVQDLYQLVRDRSNEPIIVFEPEGEPITKVVDELERIFLKERHSRINVLVGSREGIPLGVYRFADLVIDFAPGMVFSTDYAAAAGLTAIAVVLHERLGGIEGSEGDNTGCRERGTAKANHRD